MKKRKEERGGMKGEERGLKLENDVSLMLLFF